MLSQIRTILSVIIIIALLLSNGLLLGERPAAAADGEGLDLPPIELPEKGNPKLDSQLNQLVLAQTSKRAASFAQESNIELVDGNVRVIVECSPDQVDAAAKAASALGVLETSYRNLLQVVVPIPQLTALADTASIHLVRLPWYPLPAVVSEGVALINADEWQTASYNGTGVKVAILDVGFSGYTTRQSEGELPAVTTWWGPSIGNEGTSVHGTACAEIVYDIAPDADFYLANFDTIVELGNAVDYLISEGVDIISCSIGWPIGGPGDGTGLICEMVDDARAAGILWVSAVGNSAECHWQGDFVDTNSDSWHEFYGDDISNAIWAQPGDRIIVGLKWDDTWGSSDNDYDLGLIDPYDTVVAASVNPQYDAYNDPIEWLAHIAEYSGYYHIVITSWASDETANFHLYSYYHYLQYQVVSSSFCIPADSPNAIAVGAVFWNNPATLESFSSQGPTKDGRVKPDLVAPDGVSTATYGASNGVEYLSGGTGFFGTSASAPHAAGAAALVKERYPSYTPAQIQTFLEDRAVDLGDAGKDNLYGSGRLDLGSPITPPLPPTLVSPPNTATGVSLTPTFKWTSASGADYYGLYISEPPYGPANLVFDSEVDYGPISGTSFALPSSILSNEVTYYWNMRSHNSAGWGSFSDSWYFTTESVLNNPPQVTNVAASQSSPIVDITYDVFDAEQSEVTTSFEYWDGASWQACVNTTGEGTQTTGAGKSGTWNAKTNFDEHYMTDCKIKVTADDGQAENNIGSGESSPFILDTKDPTDYGCNTPTNGATDVSINPNLTCLTASDDSPPISYYFQLAENDTFTLCLQESSWQSNTTWSPSTLDNNKQYFWRVKARDSYGNETDYSSTFNFTTEPASYDIPLFAGWNLISLPLIPTDSDITVVISSATLDDVSNVGIVRAYDPATGEFPYYSPATGSGELTEMRDGYGYWVFMNAADTLTVAGRVMPVPPEVPPTYPVVEDWNLIGLKSVVPMSDYVVAGDGTESGYLLSIKGTYPVLWSYDAETGTYSNVKGEEAGMKVGHGFWLWALVPGTIVPPS